MMDFGHQRAGGVDDFELARLGQRPDVRRDAVSAEDHPGAVRHLGQLLHEHRALGPQGFDDVLVVHDLLADVDGAGVEREGDFHDVDGPFDARAKAARLSQDEFGRWHGAYASRWTAKLSRCCLDPGVVRRRRLACASGALPAGRQVGGSFDVGARAVRCANPPMPPRPSALSRLSIGANCGGGFREGTPHHPWVETHLKLQSTIVRFYNTVASHRARG